MDQISPLTLDELETLERLLDRVAERTALDLITRKAEDEPSPLLDAIEVVVKWANDEADARERQQNEAEAARLHEWLEAVGGRP